jgi:hypothetical protein
MKVYTLVTTFGGPFSFTGRHCGHTNPDDGTETPSWHHWVKEDGSVISVRKWSLVAVESRDVTEGEEER